MELIWRFTGLLAAVVVIYILVSILESAISAKINELRNRRELKNLADKCFDEIEIQIDQIVKDMLEEDKDE